jgi:trk system potassium uptake protein TrkH
MYGAMFAAPLARSLAVQDGVDKSFVIPAAIACAAGTAMWRLAPRNGRSLTRREGLALVTCTWVAASLVGALPFTISGALPRYVDAVFEAMSGLTTTGATVLTYIGDQPPSILLWRNLLQWVGGMGIVAIFVALFPVLGIGAARLLEAEMTGPQKERLQASTAHAARALWLLYVGFTVAEVVLLMAGGGLPFYDSLNIAFATVATGGFLHLQESIGAYAANPFITTVVTVFMLAAGMNFSLYYRAIRQRSGAVLYRNPEVRLYAGIFVAAALVITVDLLRVGSMPASSALQHATFQVASIQTTTGFTTADFDLWPPLSKGVLLILMFIGGCAGSTAGGLKVVRLLVVLKYIARHLMSAFSPRVVASVKLQDQTVAEPVVSAIVGVTCIYGFTVVGGFLLMTALGLEGIGALSAVATTLGNVGPGLGPVGPSQNFAFIPDAGKLVLTGLMLIGRLEFVTVMALFHPMFWHWR